MPEKEIIDKLTGLVVFGRFRIEGLEGQGKEKVVLRAMDLKEKRLVVLQLYQSNPMFLLNEPNFDFLPLATEASAREDRFLNIVENLLNASERENPGIFFWHLVAIYERLIVGLCEDTKQYGLPVMDTSTAAFQNSELRQVIKQTLTRKAKLDFVELEPWEYYIQEKTLNSVSDFLSKHGFSETLDFRRPTLLLAVIFSEGFFGQIPSNQSEQSRSFFENLTNDSPPGIAAEGLLGEFLSMTQFQTVTQSASEDLKILKSAVTQLRGMLYEDAFDKSEQLKKQGDLFFQRYNAGRNTLLRGLPRFIRTVSQHLER
jgi:hypothetical protein